MSTVDPAQARAERAAAWRAGPASRLVLVLVGGVLALSAILLGVGIMAMLDSSRITSLNSVFANWSSDLDGLLWMFGVGLTGTILATMGMMAAASAATGRSLSFPVVGPVTITLVGVAIGVTIAAPMLTPPLTVGERTDPVFFEHTPWGGGEWVWFAASWWAPLLAWALAVGSVVIAIVARARRRARRSTLAEVLSMGRIVDGVVTEAPIPSPESANLIGTITVRFDDHTGTQRWTRFTGAWAVSALTTPGDRVAVVFDPATPGDERRIWVGPAGSTTIEGFTRWGLGG